MWGGFIWPGFSVSADKFGDFSVPDILSEVFITGYVHWSIHDGTWT